jgi:hypothetical protein
MTEQEILTHYSTLSLRRNELTRASKKAHLQTVPRITPEEIEEVLERLYPRRCGTETDDRLEGEETCGAESTVPKDAPACEGEDAELTDIELLRPQYEDATS